MSQNEIELDIDTSQATEKVRALRAELTGLQNQIKEIKSAMSDATGGQRGILQGALSGAMSSATRIQNTLSVAESSGFGGANQPIGITPPGWSSVTGAFPTGGGAGGTGSIGGRMPTQGVPLGWGGVTNMGWQGDGVADPYFPTMHFPKPGSAAPTMQMAGTASPSPGSSGFLGMAGLGGGYNSGFGPGTNRAFFGAAAAFGIGSAAASTINFQTERYMRGGDDPMGRASVGAQWLSTAIGVGVGAATMNPLLGAGAYALSNTIIDPIARYLAAPEAQKQTVNQSLAGYFGARFGTFASAEQAKYTAGEDYSVGQFGRAHISSRLERIQGAALGMLRSSPGLNPSLADIGATFAGVSATLFNYGINPSGPGETTSFRFSPFEEVGRQNMDAGASRMRAGLAAGGGTTSFTEGLIQRTIGATQRSIRATGQTSETIAETYTRRLASIFGNQAPDIAKRIAPGFDPALGGNVADILGAIGPENTATFSRITNPDGSMNSQVDPLLLSRVAGTTRANSRIGLLGSLQPTGSAFAASGANLLQMQNISQLPGGKDSVAFAQEYSQYRSNRFSAFGQETLAGFGMRDLQLRGQQERLNYMPFAPGNIFANSIGIIANNRGQIGKLEGQLRLPDLSEQERYSLEGQRQGLMTENARNIGILSEGFENRLPALAAGRPAFFDRYNSIQGAGINMGRIGSPIRAYGAASAGQRADQDALVSLAGGDGLAGVGYPMSRTSELNTSYLAKIAATLDKIAAGSGGGGGSPRPSDIRNAGKAAVSRGDLGAGALQASH